MSLLTRIENIVHSWAKTNCPELPLSGLVKACQDPRHGHFQTNVAMVAAKQLRRNPRELAQEVAAFCQSDAGLEPVQVAGPGFVNFTFKKSAILEAIEGVLDDLEFGVNKTDKPETIVVDFSSPNVAKSMHVGHIRSTILGECLSRILKARGHHVIKDNHIGDWGTQFGKILLGYKRAGCPALDPVDAIAQMEKLYKDTNDACNKDEELMNQARQELVKLQSGDPENLKLWQLFREKSQSAFDSIYERLGVTFDYTLGESFYNPWLKEVVEDLEKKGIATESQGAKVVFFPDHPKLKETTFIVEKSDGAALYATTDLATIRYRVNEFKADTMIYVTDGRQQLHFQQLFDTAKRWGYTDVKFDHAWFGSILGQDKKPLKTREGDPIKLRDLLDEGCNRAAALLKEKRPDLDDEKARKLAAVIGVGSIMYADLCQNRDLDYVFDWSKLLAFDGNTAPYLINAYVRTRSILRKAGGVPEKMKLVAEHDLDYEIARKILDFGDVVDLAAVELRPHHLCTYLYDLASLFHRFFEHCPVIQAGSEDLKKSRLLLAKLAGDVLARGLYLLGICVVEEM